MRVDSTVGLPGLPSTTDAPVLLPRQWVEASMFKRLLEAIAVKKKLLAPPSCVVRAEFRQCSWQRGCRYCCKGLLERHFEC
jgi:hypothetical protein